MEAFIHHFAALPDSLRDEVFSNYDQLGLSRAMCAMTSVPESDASLLFREYIKKYSNQRSDVLTQLPGVVGIALPDFDDPNPNFICLPHVPTSQRMVGPRCIDNRPNWLTSHMGRDFVCIPQTSHRQVIWTDREWGIPFRPLPPPLVSEGWGRQVAIEAYERMYRPRRGPAPLHRWGAQP